RVEGGNLRTPRIEFARLLQLTPDSVDPPGVDDGLAVMRRLPFAIEVPLADNVSRNGQPLRGLREDVLDCHHRLWTAEAAERGLGRLVRAADAAGGFDVGQVVRVVAVKQRAPHDRR